MAYAALSLVVLQVNSNQSINPELNFNVNHAKNVRLAILRIQPIILLKFATLAQSVQS